MSYKNYKPTVWAEAINRELERLCVFGKHCNTEYEGSVKNIGDSVRILGVGKPTINEYELDSANEFTGLSTAETVEDTSTTLLINQMATFNYRVDDIDKRQAVGGVMEALSAETSEGLANSADKKIAALAWSDLAVKQFASNTKLVAGTAGANEINICEALLAAHQKLRENDVAENTKVYVTLTPAALTLYKKEMGIGRETNAGDELAKMGVADIFDGMYLDVSNNVQTKKVSGKDQLGIMVRTDRAIAYAKPMTHTEPYRPESLFADAVKGFILHGEKIVRPKELIIMNGYV